MRNIPMDVWVNPKESFFLLDWEIKNFICWKLEIHGEFIKCISQKIPDLEINLYPKGINGTEDRPMVMVIYRHQRDRPLLRGEVTLLLSDRRSLIDIKKFNFPRENEFVVLSGWPKHYLVVNRVSKKDGAIVLRFRTRVSTAVVEPIRTTLCVVDKYIVVRSDHLEGLGPEPKLFVTIEWNLDDGFEESMDLRGMIPPENPSQMCLLLVPTRLRNCVFVLAGGPTKVVKGKMFSKVSQIWKAAYLAREQVAKPGYLLIFCLKFVPVKSPVHEYLQRLPEDTDVTNRQTNPSTNPDESNQPYGADCASGWSGSSNDIEDPPHFESASVQSANQIVYDPDFQDFCRYYNRYRNFPSKDNLWVLYSAALRHGLMDIVQQLAPYLPSWNMCEALVLAMDLMDSNLLLEVHRFFVANKQQVVSSAQWRHLRNVNPRLARMFLDEFSQD